MAPVHRAALSDYLDRVNDALRDQLITLFDDLTGESRTNRSRREARWRGNSGNRSVSVILTGSRAGTWFDHGADKGSRYPLQAIRHFWGLDFNAALDEAADRCGLPRFNAKSVRRDSAEKLAQDRAERERKRAEKEAVAADEDAKKLRDDLSAVDKIIAATGPVYGSIGERYLHEAREIIETRAAVPVKPWPSSTRWSERERALVFIVTNEAGENVGVQFVAVDRDGKQDKSRYGKAEAKISRGPIGLGSVKYPGLADGPILFAEGPETGLAAWLATGYETRVVLGASGFKRIINEAPKGRKIVLLRDDDETNKQSYKAAVAGLMALSNAGFDVWDAWPYDERRQKGADFNDLLLSHGLDAVADRINDALIEQSTAHRIEHSIEKAEALVDRRVGEFFDAARSYDGKEPIVRALGVDTGVGKTHAAIAHAVSFLSDLRAAGDNRAMVLLIPEHRLGHEVVERVKHEIKRTAACLTAAAWRGMEAKKPNAEHDLDRMCDNLDGPDGVKAAREVWADVETEVCAVCPHKDRCAYLAQRDMTADIWIGSHQLMFRAPPAAVGRNGIAALIVDEDMLKSGIRAPFEMPISALSGMALPKDEEKRLELLNYRHRLERILDGAPEGFLSRSALRHPDYEIGDGDALDAVNLEYSRKVDRKAVKNWRLRLANRDLAKAVPLAKVVADLARVDGPESSGFIWIGRDRETNAKIVRVSHRASIHEDWIKPTLILDAMHHDTAALKFFWPNVEDMGRINVETPYQRIEQVIDRSYSQEFLEPPKRRRAHQDESAAAKNDEADAKFEEKARRAAKHRVEAVAAIVRIHRQNGGRTLVVANKAVALSPEFARLSSLFPKDRGIDVAWFGAMAGRDQWRDVRTLITIGRPLPSPRAVETMAATLTGVGVETIQQDGERRRSGWYKRERGHRLRRVGRRDAIRVPAECDAHPDPMVERLRWQTAVGGLMQAIGRGRGTRRTAETPLDVVVMSDAILPIPLDAFLTAEEIAPSIDDLQIAAGGVAFAPDACACASAAYPDIWRTPDAYRMDQAREQADNVNRRVPNNIRTKSNIYTYRGSFGCSEQVDGLHSIEFQIVGPKQPRRRATYDPAIVRDVRAFLDQHVGPVEWIAFDHAPPAHEPVALPIAVGAEIMLPPDPPEPPAARYLPIRTGGDAACKNRPNAGEAAKVDKALPAAGSDQDNADHPNDPNALKKGERKIDAAPPAASMTNFDGGHGPVVDQNKSEQFAPPIDASMRTNEGVDDLSEEVEEAGEDEPPIPSDIWGRLWECAAEAAMTHAAVAEAVKISACHLSNVQKGRRPPRNGLQGRLEAFIATAAPVQGRLL